MRSFSSGLAAVLLSVTVIASAALPPRPLDQLKADADVIVDGSVRSIRRQTVVVRYGTDERYILDFAAARAGKGKLKPGRISIWLQQTGTRSSGWAGPQGQNEIPKKGQKVRFYLKRQGNHYEALEPNGWSSL